jgi:hypothetical protein
MPTVTVYSLGGTWTSAPTFTYTSGVTLEERLNYTDNNGAHDNILDDMFGVGRTNQQGHTSDPTWRRGCRHSSYWPNITFWNECKRLECKHGNNV